jgi:hypothetical protein
LSGSGQESQQSLKYLNKKWRERRGSNRPYIPAFPKEKPRKPLPVNNIIYLTSMIFFRMKDLIEAPFFVSFVSTVLASPPA